MQPKKDTEYNTVPVEPKNKKAYWARVQSVARMALVEHGGGGLMLTVIVRGGQDGIDSTFSVAT